MNCFNRFGRFKKINQKKKLCFFSYNQSFLKWNKNLKNNNLDIVPGIHFRLQSNNFLGLLHLYVLYVGSKQCDYLVILKPQKKHFIDH